MYAVVGCSECGTLWIVETGAATARCPRCRTRHRTAKLRSIATCEDADRARELRSRLLADRAGHTESFSSVESFADLEEIAERPAVDDATYLTAADIDPAALEESIEDEPPRRSRSEIVLEAIDRVEDPTREAVVAYATDRDVPEAFAERVLDRGLADGIVTIADGRFRRV